MILPGPWSYSSLKKYRTCAKQFFEVKVARNFKEPEHTEATIYGKSYHEAAENYMRDGTPLPDGFLFTKPHLDTLRSIPGTLYCEHAMGLTQDLAPCGFADPEAWCRGIADLLVVNEDAGKAYCVDYKTGSAKYADMRQLELMALMVFEHFPTVKKVKTGLLFVVHNEFKKDVFVATDKHALWGKWNEDVSRLEGSYTTGVWNPTRSGLCRKHCPVESCSHYGGGKKW